MKNVYLGYLQRAATRVFYKDNVATDPDELTVTIKYEDGTILSTENEGSFEDKDIIANKVSTGEYYVEILPDLAENSPAIEEDQELGICIIYWRAVYYGTLGEADASAQEFIDLFRMCDTAEVPATQNNYVSLDALRKIDPAVFELANFSDIMRVGENASRFIDSRLDSRFDVPIRVRADTGEYDQVIIDAASLRTIERIYRKAGYAEEADAMKEESDALVEGINNGKYRLYEEITSDEIGFQLPVPDAGNSEASEDIELEIYDKTGYGGAYKQIFVVEVTTGGAVGTAVFKVETIAGESCETGITTDDEWISISDTNGLVVRFFPRSSSASLTVGDKWTIMAVPVDTEVTKTGQSLRRIKIHRF